MLDTPTAELRNLARTFRKAAPTGAVVQVVESGQELLARLGSGLPCDLIVLDWYLGDGLERGKDLLAKVRQVDGAVPVVAVAETGSVELAASTIRAGATDFLVRGERLQKRVSTVLRKVRSMLTLIENNRLLHEQNALLLQDARDRYRIIGESPQMLEVIRLIERVAPIPRPILVLGERGTGKELVARAVHMAAGHGRPFIAVNCAAFPDALLESELFGHEKGSFTGADSSAQGKFEQARGGTLFLDEIGNMSLPFQRKILRVVEYGTFTRVGGRTEIHTDARVISATNASLEDKMRRGDILPDLYDRLAFEVISVPPLREREGDIEILARHFLDEFMREIPALRGKRLAPSALRALGHHAFPGNVRELKNLIERAAYRDTTQEITPTDIGLIGNGETTTGLAGTFEERVEAFKRRTVIDAIEAAKGNRARAARELGLSYHQLRYLCGKYGV